MKNYDVIIIGGGVVGCAILSRLSHTDARVLLLECEDDVAMGASKANSGIVHAGYDAEPNTLKAKLNVKGNAMFGELCAKLNVPYERIGSLVLAKKGERNKLVELLERGKQNGVPDLEIISGDRLKAEEPNLSDEVDCALYAPTAGVVSPYQLTVALAEHGIYNGAEVKTDSRVTGVERLTDGFTVHTSDEAYHATVVINSAGGGAAYIDGMVRGKALEVSYKRGDYYLFDSSERRSITHTCFPLPDDNGKGILVSPTADGNVLAGPTGIAVDNPFDTATTAEGLAAVKRKSLSMFPNLNYRKCIRVFAGVRSVCGEDFVIESLPQCKDFITLVGICSPGLSAAPAIAEYVMDLLANSSLKLSEKHDIAYLPKRIVTRELSNEQWAELIKARPDYAAVVCRCERITEGEINDALNSPLPPHSTDALKRRVRTGMGRCQGGFCTPRVMDIMAKHYGVSIDEITKCGKGSNIVRSDVMEGIE